MDVSIKLSKRRQSGSKPLALHCESCCEWKSCSTLRMGRRSSLRSRGVDGRAHEVVGARSVANTSSSDLVNSAASTRSLKLLPSEELSQAMHTTAAVPIYAQHNCCPKPCTSTQAQQLLSQLMHNTTAAVRIYAQHNIKDDSNAPKRKTPRDRNEIRA